MMKLPLTIPLPASVKISDTSLTGELNRELLNDNVISYRLISNGGQAGRTAASH